jgi:hypothetical protein
MKDSNDKSDDLTQAVVAMTTAAAGAIVGGPAGAVIATFIERSVAIISRRQRQRVETTLAVFLEQFNTRIAAGDEPRADWFAPDGSGGSASEAFEATMLAAQDEYEERKLTLLGRLLASLAFEAQIDRAQANLLVRTLKDLSYRQLLLLRLFAQPGAIPRDVPYEGGSYIAGSEPDTQRLIGLMAETYDLYTRGLVNIGGKATYGMTSIVPSQIETQGMGSRLAILCGLNEVTDAAGLNAITSVFMSAGVPDGTPPREPPPTPQRTVPERD